MVLSGAMPKPGRRFVNAICREFNVNPEWLINGTEPVFSMPELPLPPERAEVLAKYLMLSNEKQKMIEEMIDAFLLKMENEGKGKKASGSGRGHKK